MIVGRREQFDEWQLRVLKDPVGGNRKIVAAFVAGGQMVCVATRTVGLWCHCGPKGTREPGVRHGANLGHDGAIPGEFAVVLL